jgi:2-polyprenyl-3-methyl-5-hydroxy-6-metoxy-1,4-benzoquinol methylase
VALIFDDQTRPETTGVYCRRALAELVTVQHFHPKEAQRIPNHGFDLYLRIDDGLRYDLPADLRPLAWWAIDTHMDFAWALSVARTADLVFAAQRDGAEQLQRQGIASAEWLPLACDPALHDPHDVPKSVDFCFVGNLFDGPRANLVNQLRQRFRNHFVGRCYFEEMARAYSAARIVFNRSIRNDINMRVFEALACGSLLLTNDLADNGQADLFRDGVHLATYREADDLIDKVDFYLRRDETREAIARAGRAEVQARHTYRHRMAAFLQKCERQGCRMDIPVRRGLACRMDILVRRASPTDKNVHPTAASPTDKNVHPTAASPTDRNVHPTAESPTDRNLRPTAESPTDRNVHPTAESPTDRNVRPTAEHVTDRNVRPTAEHGDARDSYYFEFERPELVALVPLEAQAVLDVGCGAGRLGETLKGRQPVAVTGIEAETRAAQIAEGRLDRVFCGDVEEMELPFEPASFDVVLCGDVLEHLREPETVLRRIRPWLKPGGQLVASIPNVRHYSVIHSLLAGNWTYQAAGLLDRTHLHFFTRRSIEELFAQAGYRIHRMQVVPGPGYDDWHRQGRPETLRVGGLCLDGLPQAEIEEFFLYQWLVSAEPLPAESSASPPAARSTEHAARPRRIRFTQDFTTDFDQIDLAGPPFALVRFADGEREVCQGQPLVVARDGWVFPGGESPLTRALNEALRYTAPDYYIGISDSCCDRAAHEWYLQQVRVPLEQLTFSNLFVNANYRRFRRLDLRGAAVVSCGRGDFRIPEDLFAGNFDVDALVEQLLRVDRPILVSAGPLSAVIIHRYWLRAPRKQPILDVGSALDEQTKGYRTRSYQYPGTANAERVCRW